MALPARQQMTYWGIAAAVFFVLLWGLGNVILPFLVGGAVAYFLDPIADRLERRGHEPDCRNLGHLDRRAW